MTRRYSYVPQITQNAKREQKLEPMNPGFHTEFGLHNTVLSQIGAQAECCDFGVLGLRVSKAPSMPISGNFYEHITFPDSKYAPSV